MTTLIDLSTGCNPTWCPGCGNMAIWAAFKNAAVSEGWDNTNSVLVAGIGCHGNLLNFTKITSFEGLHGRTLPVATGIKLANQKLNVFVFSGDGDSLGEGGNHFIHTCRRNHNITLFIHNNGLYGLTTGQTSPTTIHGQKTKSTPSGNPDEPFSPLALAIASGATFAARAYSSNMPRLTEIMIAAAQHPGFSVVDILQPCITFNKVCTNAFYQENTYNLDENHDVTNREAALKKAFEWGPKQIPLGIFFKVEKPTFESQLPQISQKPLIENPVTNRDLEDLFKKYT